MRLSMTPCSITSLLVLCLKAEGVATVHKCVQQLECEFIRSSIQQTTVYIMQGIVWDSGETYGTPYPTGS